MSEEQLKAFLEKVKVDSSLQEKLKAAVIPDGQLASEDVVSIAKEAGFVISAGDLAAKEGLTDDQLEGVTGGNAILASLAEVTYISSDFTSVPLLLIDGLSGGHLQDKIMRDSIKK